MNRLTFAIGVGLMGCGVVLTFLEKNVGAATTYGAAVFCFIFAFLPEFKRFKGFGVEAELLEKKVQEADAILQRLNGFMQPMSELLFTLVARSGRFGGSVPREDSYRIVNSLKEQLIGAGVPLGQITHSMREWHRINLFDMARPIASGVEKHLG
jgi:hypothetical protein